MNPSTIAEIAAALEADREEVRGLVRFLIARGLAVPRGWRPPASGRGGRPEPLYVLLDEAPDGVRQILRRAIRTRSAPPGI